MPFGPFCYRTRHGVFLSSTPIREGGWFRWTSYPLVGVSPFLFHKLLGSVVRGAVPEGVFLVHYLHDVVLLSTDRALLPATQDEVAARLRRARFLVSTKSTLSPVQVSKSLGKIVNLKERFIWVHPFVFLQLMLTWLRLATRG